MLAAGGRGGRQVVVGGAGSSWEGAGSRGRQQVVRGKEQVVVGGRR